MKKILLSSLVLAITTLTHAQKSESPYVWDWTTDGIWTGAALATTTGGFILIQNKKGISEAELTTILADQENINAIDQWLVGNYSESANTLSDIPFFLSFATPGVLFFDDETNDHAGQILGLYLESLATTASLYTLSAGLINRSRPYVYSDEADMSRRLSSSGQRSFYSGHVAATATATFFVAKVYSDFNPDSPAIPFVWAGAAVLPAGVAYFRLEAGQHYLTDVLLGYGLGAVVGYYVPELHKRKDRNLSIVPVGGRSLTGDIYNGMALQLTF